jgi:predicted DNA-binding protein
MAALKKGTKLTDNPKNYMLRVRMDSDTVEKLDIVCKKENITRSEAVRKGIEKQYEEIKK